MRIPKAFLAAVFTGLAMTTATLVANPAMAQEERADWLSIEVGKSAYLETPRAPTSIAVTDPAIINVENLGLARKFQVQGKKVGSTDLLVSFGPGVSPLTYEVVVQRDLTELVRRIDSIVEGEAPRVYPLEDRIVVEGPVDDLDTLEQVALVARIYDPNFVNLMSVRGDHQVQLEVLFAEVQRSALREMGLNILLGGTNFGGTISSGGSPQGTGFINNALSALTPNGGIVPTPGDGSFGVGGFFNAGALNIVAMAQLLDQYEMGKILSQPTLVSLSGQQAEFLAGGQVPIAQPSGQGQITVVYKDYGVHLTFVPTVLANDVIDVRMTVEISEIDQNTTTNIAGFPAPGYLTRKAQTHLRIENGKTFAVAGMLNETSAFTRSGVPGLSRIPILGTFFRTVKHTRAETEVVIYVSPRLVRPLAAGEVPPAPGTTENNNPSDIELFLLGTGVRPGSRTAEPTGVVGLQR